MRAWSRCLFALGCLSLGWAGGCSRWEPGRAEGREALPAAQRALSWRLEAREVTGLGPLPPGRTVLRTAAQFEETFGRPPRGVGFPREWVALLPEGGTLSVRRSLTGGTLYLSVTHEREEGGCAQRVGPAGKAYAFEASGLDAPEVRWLEREVPCGQRLPPAPRLTRTLPLTDALPQARSAHFWVATQLQEHRTERALALDAQLAVEQAFAAAQAQVPSLQGCLDPRGVAPRVSDPAALRQELDGLGLPALLDALQARSGAAGSPLSWVVDVLAGAERRESCFVVAFPASDRFYTLWLTQT